VRSFTPWLLCWLGVMGASLSAARDTTTRSEGLLNDDAPVFMDKQGGGSEDVDAGLCQRVDVIRQIRETQLQTQYQQLNDLMVEQKERHRLLSQQPNNRHRYYYGQGGADEDASVVSIPEHEKNVELVEVHQSRDVAATKSITHQQEAIITPTIIKKHTIAQSLESHFPAHYVDDGRTSEERMFWIDPEVSVGRRQLLEKQKQVLVSLQQDQKERRERAISLDHHHQWRPHNYEKFITETLTRQTEMAEAESSTSVQEHHACWSMELEDPPQQSLSFNKEQYLSDESFSHRHSSSGRRYEEDDAACSPSVQSDDSQDSQSSSIASDEGGIFATDDSCWAETGNDEQDRSRDSREGSRQDDRSDSSCPESETSDGRSFRGDGYDQRSEESTVNTWISSDVIDRQRSDLARHFGNVTDDSDATDDEDTVNTWRTENEESEEDTSLFPTQMQDFDERSVDTWQTASSPSWKASSLSRHAASNASDCSSEARSSPLEMEDQQHRSLHEHDDRTVNTWQSSSQVDARVSLGRSQNTSNLTGSFITGDDKTINTWKSEDESGTRLRVNPFENGGYTDGGSLNNGNTTRHTWQTEQKRVSWHSSTVPYDDQSIVTWQNDDTTVATSANAPLQASANEGDDESSAGDDSNTWLSNLVSDESSDSSLVGHLVTVNEFVASSNNNMGDEVMASSVQDASSNSDSGESVDFDDTTTMSSWRTHKDQTPAWPELQQHLDSFS